MSRNTRPFLVLIPAISCKKILTAHVFRLFTYLGKHQRGKIAWCTRVSVGVCYQRGMVRAFHSMTIHAMHIPKSRRTTRLIRVQKKWILLGENPGCGLAKQGPWCTAIWDASDMKYPTSTPQRPFPACSGAMYVSCRIRPGIGWIIFVGAGAVWGIQHRGRTQQSPAKVPNFC